MMTGKELKEFIKSRGWTIVKAAGVFGVERTTLFRQFKCKKIGKLYELICKDLNQS